MKRIILATATVFSIFVVKGQHLEESFYYSDEIAYSYNREEERLNGNVKAVIYDKGDFDIYDKYKKIIFTANYIDRNQDIYGEDYINDNDDNKYDERGNPIKVIIYENGEPVHYKTYVYKYDDENKEVERLVYDRGLFLRKREVYKDAYGYPRIGWKSPYVVYDEKGNVLEGIKEEYDSRGNKVKEIEYRKGDARKETFYQYDDRNNLVEEKYINLVDDKYLYDDIDFILSSLLRGYDVSKITYKYDDKNRKIEEIKYDSNEKMISHYQWKYNMSGVLIEEIEQNGDSKNITRYTDKEQEYESFDFDFSDYFSKKSKIRKGYILSRYVYENGEYESRDIYKYDDKYNLLSRKTFGKNNELVSMHIIKYDKKGNKIKEKDDYSITTYIYNDKGEIVNTVYDYKYEGKEWDFDEKKWKVKRLKKSKGNQYNEVDNGVEENEGMEMVEAENDRFLENDANYLAYSRLYKYDKLGNVVGKYIDFEFEGEYYNIDNVKEFIDKYILENGGLEVSNESYFENYKYDKHNRLEKEFYGGERWHREDYYGELVKYRYDKKGHWVRKKIKTYDYYGKQIAIIRNRNVYNHFGKIQKVVSYADGVEYKTSSYVYDDKNNLIAQKTIETIEVYNYETGTYQPVQRELLHKYEYNSNNQRIGEEHYMDNVLQRKIKYNDKGDVIVYGSNDYDNKFNEVQYSYEYDERGNWTKRIKTSNTGEPEVLERSILYYE